MTDHGDAIVQVHPSQPVWRGLYVHDMLILYPSGNRSKFFRSSLEGKVVCFNIVSRSSMRKQGVPSTLRETREDGTESDDFYLDREAPTISLLFYHCCLIAHVARCNFLNTHSAS